MKKSSLLITASLLMGVFTNVGCANTPTEKLETAKENSVQAQANLEKANEDYQAEITEFKKETMEKITANEKSIGEFNSRIAKEKAKAKEEYKHKIAELEQKNSDMKKKLDDYKADGKEKWAAFKTEFNHDMDELGKSLKDFTIKNTK
jgi:hypothetical protein